MQKHASSRHCAQRPVRVGVAKRPALSNSAQNPAELPPSDPEASLVTLFACLDTNSVTELKATDFLNVVTKVT